MGATPYSDFDQHLLADPRISVKTMETPDSLYTRKERKANTQDTTGKESKAKTQDWWVLARLAATSTGTTCSRHPASWPRLYCQHRCSKPPCINSGAHLTALQTLLYPLVAPAYWRSKPLCKNSGVRLTALQTPLHF